ncbi:MAG: DNA-directed RNA polymerase subunit beta' [Candidatus Colwellbacteria bacterium]|nr:DNA-directed RNA polymerase subunit beta' [Candidatus Colwellbacteria bacterium]
MNKTPDFTGLKIKIASPEDILSWSYGEVIKPETINYRTQRPEKDGLFSERIFGPTKDWECYCGKYRKIRYKGIVCDKCGVEVTRSIVRRERMGHITLATPVVHTWFLRSVPSVIGLILDEPLKSLEKVVYYAAHIITNVDETKRKEALSEVVREFKVREKDKKGDLEAAVIEAKDFLNRLRPGRVLSDEEFMNFGKRFGHIFTVAAGGEGVRQVLARLDLRQMVVNIEAELETARDATRIKKLLRRLKLVKSMVTNNVRPEWMVLTILPVLPPDLRPMVALDGGRYATSDLNDLYRRVINRNNRLKKLMELKAPDVIVINEKRMLQEAVDVLIDNAKARQVTRGRRPARSLADMLRGKQGRFRQNLLGKRVDYSGRSVIVVGPHLRIDECGIPKRMALELFRPFIINKVIERGLAYNIKNSNRLIDQAPPEIWEILEEIIIDKKVLLNRAPTLHRLSIQAFRPVLIEDLAIQVPPLVTSAFNADFDGDQMAVPLPLSPEAQYEANHLMLSKTNLLKPASGEAVSGPTLDMVLGCYYLTKIETEEGKPSRILSSKTEARLAYESGVLELHAPVKIQELETTYGRLIFNDILPDDFEFVNETFNKKSLTALVGRLVAKYDSEKVAEILDKIKEAGFYYASISGISLGFGDLVVPDEKETIITEAEKLIALIREQYEEGFLTARERKERIIEVWQDAKNKIDKLIPAKLGPSNSVYMIITSGARGSWSQPNLEYFISTHGSRKGLVDTALRTAEAGYLTRRLIDTAQDVIVREENCRTKRGIALYREDGADFGYSFADRLASRTALTDIKIGRKIVVRTGEIINSEEAKEIEKSNLPTVEVRSPITCKTLYGICSRCYGLDLARNEPVKLGEAVGIIAAQSIGELGTQLTLRTFHAGGVAGRDITAGLPRVEELFENRTPKQKGIVSSVEGVVTKIEDRGSLRVIEVRQTGDARKKNKMVEYPVLKGTEILVDAGSKVMPGDVLTEGHLDPKEIFELKGKVEAARYLIRETQRIYRGEGANVHDKYMEVIVRQMFNRVKVTDPGESEFVLGEVVDKSTLREANQKLEREDKARARAEELILGITRAALLAEGFLAAASFIETTRVLIRAASEGRVDHLRGLKENVIIGRLVPVGTAFREDIVLEEDEKPEEGGEYEEIKEEVLTESK